MNYTRMNLKEWSRGDLFQFYIDKMRIVMSLTVDMDVTNLKAYSKKHHLDFYPLMVWVVSKVVNAHDEFKYSWDADGKLIMPLTMNIHHAVADGFHLSRFFNEVQELIDSLD